MKKDVAIIGGATSCLSQDLENLTGDEVTIAINHHFYVFTTSHPVQITPDYMAFLDDMDRSENNLRQAYGAFPGKTISIRKGQSDYLVKDHKKLKISDSGQLAVYWASTVFDGTIKLCGFNLRANTRKARRDDTIQKWQEFLDHLGNTDKLIAYQEPLKEMIHGSA